jgi:hypothetical protein
MCIHIHTCIHRYIHTYSVFTIPPQTLKGATMYYIRLVRMHVCIRAWCVCMYVCMYGLWKEQLCTTSGWCVCMCVYLHVCMYVHIRMYVYTRMCLRLDFETSNYVLHQAGVYACVYTCMMCMYVYIDTLMDRFCMDQSDCVYVCICV